VETSPSTPVPTNESVTLTFHADRGNGWLADCDCTVYAHTGYGPVPPESEEEIQTMNFVFRNADGSKEGKTADGGNIYVEVNDVQDTAPVLSVAL
jgi:hypothetical protein